MRHALASALELELKPCSQASSDRARTDGQTDRNRAIEPAGRAQRARLEKTNKFVCSFLMALIALNPDRTQVAYICKHGVPDTQAA